jgi:hypothetical protein
MPVWLLAIHLLKMLARGATSTRPTEIHDEEAEECPKEIFEIQR